MAKCFSPHVIERVPTCFEFCETKRMDGLFYFNFLSDIRRLCCQPPYSSCRRQTSVNQRVTLSIFCFFPLFIHPFSADLNRDWFHPLFFVCFFCCIDFTTDTHMQTHRKKKKREGDSFQHEGERRTNCDIEHIKLREYIQFSTDVRKREKGSTSFM